jgi:membrane protease YdiL (CAAX protease family)
MTIGGVELDLRLTFLIVLGTILPMIDFYHRFTDRKACDRFLLYMVIPLIIIFLLFRERPEDYGFRIGRWREGLLWTVAVCAVLAGLLWFLARTPAMQRYYTARAANNSTPFIIYITAVELFAWEFIWRGVLLFGLARILGPGPAILIQAIPFAFMHLGKPEVETLTTLFGGMGFAFIAWRTGSFYYPFLIHWFIAAFTQLVASGRIG